MNNFKNFQAKHNLKIISFNNPKVIIPQINSKNNTDACFYSSNFILVTSKKIQLPKYDEYVSNLHIKPNDIIVYTLLFTRNDIQSVQLTGRDETKSLRDLSALRASEGCLSGPLVPPEGAKRPTASRLVSDPECNNQIIKTPDDQHIVIRFYDEYYKIY